VAGVVLPDQRLAVHARGTSDGADVPARIEVAAASGEVVLLDPRMIVSLMPRTAYGAVAVTDSFSLGFSHRERSPGVGIRLPAGENRGGLPAGPLPSVRGHENTATMAPSGAAAAQRARQPRESPGTSTAFGWWSSGSAATLPVRLRRPAPAGWSRTGQLQSRAGAGKEGLGVADGGFLAGGFW